MDIHTGQQRRFPAVAIAIFLLILCIFPGQLLITKLFPSLSGLAQINPTLVFFDIPIQLPVVIDLILAPGLFLLVFPIVVLFFPSQRGVSRWRQASQKAGAALVGLFALLCCMLAGGSIYYLVHDHLTKQVQKGIDAMGINMALHLTYPGYETIYVRGSLVLLVCFIIGMVIFIRKIRKQPASLLTREQRMTPYERMLQEKRMNAKQMMQPKEEHKINTGWKRETMQPAFNSHSRFCDSQPVIFLTPIAVNYLPM